jgi:hypothetical protein
LCSYLLLDIMVFSQFPHVATSMSSGYSSALLAMGVFGGSQVDNT